MILERKTTEITVNMAAYADDFTAGGSIKSLKGFWDTLCWLSLKCRCYAEAKKSWLIIKEEFNREAKDVFKDSAVKITSSRRRHLGLLLGEHRLKKSI